LASTTWQGTTTVHFTPKPRTLDASSAHYELTLEPQGQFKLFLAIACSAEGDAVRTDIAYHQSINAARRALDTASSSGDEDRRVEQPLQSLAQPVGYQTCTC
jgi:hypothetical protein